MAALAVFSKPDQHRQRRFVAGAGAERQDAARGSGADLRRGIGEALAEARQQPGDRRPVRDRGARARQAFEGVGQQAEQRCIVELAGPAEPERGQGAAGGETADPRQRLGREGADHRVAEHAGEGRHRAPRAQVAQRLNRRHLQPRIGVEEREQVGDRAPVAEPADGEDRRLRHVEVAMAEHGAQRFDGARVAEMVEQQDCLQHHVGLGVGEQPHRQLKTARAAQLEHLEAGVAQHRVMVVAQVLGDALLRQQVGPQVQHPLADARAGVAHQQLDLRAALAQRHGGQCLEQAHGAVPGELGGSR